MLKKVKYYTIGLTSGILISFGVSYADESYYQLIKVNYPILINGNKLESDLPILNYNGNTYLPLKKVSEAIGTKINWNGSSIIIGENSNNEGGLVLQGQNIDVTSYGTAKVTCTVKNNDNNSHTIKVKAALMNENGIPISTATSLIPTTVNPNDTEGFEITFWSIPSGFKDYSLKIVEQ